MAAHQEQLRPRPPRVAPGTMRERAHVYDGSRINCLAGGQASPARSEHDADPVEQLGRLDDAVFEAIAGCPGALVGLRAMWPEVKSTLGRTLVEESRDQYVRHALRVWRESLEGSELRDPATAIAALDVVSLLFDE